MWLTVGGKRGTRTTVGLPGTGLFWTEQHRGSPALPSPTVRSRGANVAMGLFLVAVLVALVAMIVVAG